MNKADFVTKYGIADMVEQINDGNRKDSTVVGFDDYTFGIVYTGRDTHAYAGFYKNGKKYRYIP